MKSYLIPRADIQWVFLNTNPLFKIFAPTNAALDKIPMVTLETLLKPEGTTRLQGVLTHKVLDVKYSARKIMKAIKKGKGKAEFTTVTTADIHQSNEVIHLVNTVNLIGM